MKFKLDVMRSAVTAAAAVAMLASCGGGTQIEAFVPKRVISFGDETSLIEVDSAHPGQGRKYTVNGVKFFTDTSVSPSVNIPVVPTTPACESNPIWVQQLAAAYGFAFSACAASGTVTNSEMYAASGANAADIAGQIDLFMAGNNGTFGSNDLVTVMAGMNDVIELYTLNQPSPTANASALIAAARQAGTEVGAQVVRIANRGAKVIVSTIPDMGLSPFAAKEEADHPGEGRAALLSQLSAELNTRLRVKLQDVPDGGRAVGLVLGDELVSAMYRSPLVYGFTGSVSQGACTTTLPACDQTTTQDSYAAQTSATLTYGGAWLWADDRHLGAVAQSQLGALALSRARSNPF